jgi:dienelactone hydrolase
MTIQTRTVEYTHQDVLLEGYLAWDDAHSGPRLCVVVSHAFRGREQFECQRAEDLAALGYVGFALDLYGKGVLGESNEEATALMTPFLEDRAMLQSRLLASVSVAAEQPEVDSGKMAAIGYCFGGACALDLARVNAPLAGVASFHGLLFAPGNTEDAKISAKILVEHGWDDPMVPPEMVIGFTEEMTAAGADWQLHGHGGTMHAFTNPEANDPDFGTVYNEAAHRRSWQSLENFLAEIF